MTGGASEEQGIILIVDDNTTNLSVLFDYLKKADFRVLVAQNGAAALELVDEVLPDLILLDIMMPEMDGFETCAALKAREDAADVPVIFMTALTDTVDKVKGFSLGAVDYITKPFQHEEVLARVNTHLTIQQLKKHLLKKNEELEVMNKNLELQVQEKTRQLVHQEKTAIIGRMIQGIVHNLKTPLAVIHNSNEVIRKKVEKITADEGRESLAERTQNFLSTMPTDSEMVKQAHKRIMEIINNLMLKSRMDQNVERKMLNVNDLLRQEFEFLKANTQFKNKTEKELLLDEAIPEIYLIYSNVAQIIENLINNALDAMWDKPKKQLIVRSRQDADNVYIDIEDTGGGIPADKLEAIFDPFFTTKPAKGEEAEGEPTGTGLGLHTCVELLKPFNGEIRVDSEFGTGSTFTVVLPKQQPETTEN